MAKRPTWSTVKAGLKSADTGDLLALLQELYRLDPRNREFLHARFVDRTAALERARKAVGDALCPDPFSKRGVRLRDGRQTIRSYVTATGDAEGELDLMLVYIEAGTSFAADLGYDDPAFFASLDTMLAEVLDRVRGMQPAEAERYVIRFEELTATGRHVGWGWGDALTSASRIVADRAARS